MTEAALEAPARAATGAAGSGIREIRVEIAEAGDLPLLVPAGCETPHDLVTSVRVEGAEVTAQAAAEGLGLGALIARPTAPSVAVVYSVAAAASPVYPDAAFRPRANPHTTAADALAAAAREVAARAGGGRAAVEALVAETEARFAYAHPDIRFTDGLDAVPYLSCGLTPGSCVDINTYLVASLRAAGIEAAYIVGYFFPQETGGVTHDKHCWVVTRAEGEILEWDIAHHIKAGLGPTRPGLNPRPGRRVAVGHSMGHVYRFPAGRIETRLLAEPVRIEDGEARPIEGLTITAR